MAQNKSNNTGNISGRNIYLDRHGQTVFYDWLTKKGYLIDKDNESKFYIYKNRYVLILMIIILCSEYFPGWVQAALAGIAICIVAELLFRFRFLRGLREAKKFDREKPLTMLKTVIDGKDKKRTILRVILYLAFAILIIVNAIMIEADIAIMALSIILGILSGYCSVINLIGLIKMK